MQISVFLFFLLFPSVCGAFSESKQRCLFPNSIDTTPSDLQIMQRQTGQSAPTEAAIGVPSSCNCRHGFPQAFAMDPMPASTGRMNSGLIKLTCPLLVNAIDALEDEGMISSLNENMERNEYMQRNAKNIHGEHAQIRKEMIVGNDEQMDDLQRRLGENGASAFLNSGVAGSTLDSLDVKCMHAWMGDYLFRSHDGRGSSSSSSPLGKAICEALTEKGVDRNGTLNCNMYCDCKSVLPAAPPNPRNKQRHKSQKEVARRKRKKDGDFTSKE